jgi:hypothetical protein
LASPAGVSVETVAPSLRRALAALARQPDPLPVGHPGGDVDVVAPRTLGARQRDRAPPTPVCLFDGQDELGFLIRPADRTPSAALPSEDAAQQIVEVDAFTAGGEPLLVDAGTARPARPS